MENNRGAIFDWYDRLRNSAKYLVAHFTALLTSFDNHMGNDIIHILQLPRSHIYNAAIIRANASSGLMGEILYISMSWRVSLLLEGSFGRCPSCIVILLDYQFASLTRVAQRTEYLALFASLTLVLLEGIIHLITLCLRKL